MADDNLNPIHTDTGLWHLTVYMSSRSLEAWLSFKGDTGRSPRLLASESWAPTEEGLLQKISNSVYDHPEMLDDYSASIIIESTRTMMVPDAMLEEEGEAEKVYSRVYPGQEEEVITDDNNGPETALLTLVSGLRSFLQRTFPGARIHSHLNRLKSRFRTLGTGMRIFASIRDGELDLIAFNGENLLSASTQKWREWSDIVYRILNLAEIYNMQVNESELFLDGVGERLEKAESFLRPKFAVVRSIDRDSLQNEIPLAAALELSRQQ